MNPLEKRSLGIVALSFVLVFASARTSKAQTLFGQFYLSVGAKTAYYQSNYIQPDHKLQTHPSVNFGAVIFENKLNNIKIDLDADYIRHGYNETTYRKKYLLHFDDIGVTALGLYSPVSHFWLLTGFHVGMSRISLIKDKINSSFRTFSKMYVMGLQYQVSDLLAVGFRYYLGLNYLLTYERVGDYGELISNQKDMKPRIFGLNITLLMKNPK